MNKISWSTDGVQVISEPGRRSQSVQFLAEGVLSKRKANRPKVDESSTFPLTLVQCTKSKREEDERAKHRSISCLGRHSGCDLAACSCSKPAHPWPPWDNHARRDQPLRLHDPCKCANKATRTRRRQLTVVAFLTLSAVAGHVAETAAGVASLLTTTIAATEATSITATLRAAPCDMTDSATLVALLTANGTVVFTGLWALARKVTDTTATVASLLLGGYGTFTA